MRDAISATGKPAAGRPAIPFSCIPHLLEYQGAADSTPYRTTHRGSGGHHGEGSDAQQQRKADILRCGKERRYSILVGAARAIR
jgi:hypothetical protein